MNAKGFLGLMLFLLLGGAVFQVGINSHKSMEQAKHIREYVPIVGDSAGKIYQITQVSKELIRIDSTQQGLCDTCVAGVTSAVISNRLVVKELVKKTILMQKLCDSLDIEIKKVNVLLSRRKKSNAMPRAGDLTARIE